MLTAIELENYRGFKSYRMEGLTRVNLLVGKNNCGKTSVLEAAHLLASGGDLRVLVSSAMERGETLAVAEDQQRGAHRRYVDVSHFFHGHQFGPTAHFSVLADDSLDDIAVRVVARGELTTPHTLLGPEDVEGEPSGLAIQIQGSRHPLAQRGVPVSGQGALATDLFFPHRGTEAHSTGIDRPVQYIATESLRTAAMSEMWNRVILEGREVEAVEALRILEPRLRSIVFLSGENTYRYGGRTGIVAGFESPRQRVPLGTLGDGVFRLLALSLSLIRVRGGMLLVDEIDTGVHYSVMGQMWRLVAETARASDIQVLATTHSLDCVRGLAWLCENCPELADLTSVHKIDASLPKSVAFQSGDIVLAAKQSIEMR